MNNDIFTQLHNANLSQNDAFKVLLVHLGTLPAAIIQKPLPIVVQNVSYTTFPKARIVREGEPPQVPQGATHIVYNTILRNDSYNIMNADQYLGNPCPHGPYPRPMRYTYRLADNNDPFYTISCAINSNEPNRLLVTFSYAASLIHKNVIMSAEYDAAAIRAATAGATTQEEARNILRAIGIEREYPDYIVALRRLAFLHGEPIMNICINAEDPFTLESLEDIPRREIVRFGRTIDGAKYCASARSLYEYIAPRIRTLQPLINPLDRSDKITQEDLTNLYTIMRRLDPNFTSPLEPIIIEGDMITFRGIPMRKLEIVILPETNIGSIIISEMGAVPLNVNLGNRYTSERLLRLLSDHDNIHKLVEISIVHGRLFPSWRLPYRLDPENWIKNGQLDTSFFRQVVDAVDDKLSQ